MGWYYEQTRPTLVFWTGAGGTGVIKEVQNKTVCRNLWLEASKFFNIFDILLKPIRGWGNHLAGDLENNSR